MAKLSQNVARQRMAEALKRMRRGGMTEETMRTTSLGDLFKKTENPERASMIQSKVGFDMSKPAGELVGGYIGELYAGRKDTLADKLAMRRQEKRDFAQAQRQERQKRQDKFISKRDELRKKSLKNFGGKMGDGPDTPGLDRHAAMQKAGFGGNTALAGSVAKGVGQQSRRTITPRSAVHGAEARAHERAGNQAAAADARRRQFEGRAGEPNIRTQEERRREKRDAQRAQNAQRQKERADRQDARDARKIAKEARKRAREDRRKENEDRN